MKSKGTMNTPVLLLNGGYGTIEDFDIIFPELLKFAINPALLVTTGRAG